MSKTRLTLIPPDASTTRPPRQLGQYGTELWDAVMLEYRIEDRGGIELLAQACAALDRAEALSAAIERDGGPIVHSRTGVPRAHPGCKDELACRAFVCRTLQRLGVTSETIKPPGRPPTPTGWEGGE